MLSRQTERKPFTRYGCARFEIALFPETRPNQKRSSETFQTTFALTSDSLGIKTARAYFLIAVRILSAMWVAPAVRPDIPISDAAASLINSFILSLFLVFVLRML